jgi:hypothetical protein
MSQPSRRLVLSLLAGTALAGAFAGSAFALTPVRPAKPIPMVNQATRDPALVKVIAEMLAAAKAKDWKRLSPHISERIQLDFGGGAGRAEMGRRLAKRAAHWEELVWVLEHGGSFAKDGAFMAPYTFSADTGKLDPFEAGILVAKAKVHAEPREDSAVLAELDRTAVKVVDWKTSDKTPSPFYRRTDWVQVELAGKREGWLQAKYVRSAVDFRAAIQKVRGVWMMNAFIAGD